MAFYPTDFHEEFQILPPKFGSFITKFSLSTSTRLSDGLTHGAGGHNTIDFDFRRRDFRGRQPELGTRADLGETDETAPAAHGTDSADT